MHLIQLLLPLYDNNDVPFPKPMFDSVHAELTEAFGGVTAYVRSPAVGAWEASDGSVQRDDVILLEVMADAVDQPWWSAYRSRLEKRFHQDEIMIRATSTQRL